ncbi:MAG TPA: agmatine deiminase family protein [Microbacteriaceae bacterium]|nr:agmatine deiminase family protein [Microbacteriaceae bacterium]
MTQWRMPAEGDPHERTWLAWPTSGYTLGDDAASAEAARRTWASVANAIAEFEPVTVVVDPRDRDIAPRYLSAAIDRLVAPLDDAWVRDSGPTFVIGVDGRLGAVDWVFNGWGGQGWASWGHDALLAPIIAEHAGAELVASTLTNEGGGMHVDGLGTVLLTATVQLDPGRNPGWSMADVEAELARTIGATRPIWLPRGLTRDSERYGTRGHIDIVATMPEPGRVLVHAQRDPAHPDHVVSAEAVRLLAGEGLEVVALPAPRTLRDDEGWVDWSYVNHSLVNGGVVAGVFDDPGDAEALDILRSVYPGREVVGVDARELFARGGGVHCITQHQPRTH